MPGGERNAVRIAMEHRASPPPPPDDPAALLGWLRDRTMIEDLYSRYAYGVDSVDMDLVRSVFHPDCVVVGTMEEGSLDDYLEGLEDGLLMYHATMHFKGNQYVEIDGDRAFVETWVLGHHMEAPGSPIDHLLLGLRYKDDVVRVGDEAETLVEGARGGVVAVRGQRQVARAPGVTGMGRNRGEKRRTQPPPARRWRR